ncbi:MAG: AI-2E family transporter [Eubacterium sp.]|nr:AI-2E family transporter [Eubacterium sp.]MCM1216694.1 AI-2E family transporter [Lachnospiraceae bacterium]MCM1240382.1 AI-2E family transporter [Lachnospiraceae bacterium]
MAGKILQNRPILLLLLTGAVFFFLKIITPLTAPVLLALLFVTIFGPLLQKWQRRLHLHRQVGVIILLLLAGSILGILVWVLFSWIVGSLPDWIMGLDTLEQAVSGVLHEICRFVERTIGIDGEYLEQMILSRLQEGIDYFQLEFLPGMLSQSLEYVKGFAAIGGFLVTFLIAAILLAKDYDEIMNQLLDREECHVFLEIICGIIRYLATFVKAQVIIMSVIGVLAAAVLGICGIRHGALWGMLAGVLDALPFIGTGIVLIPLGIQQIFYGQYGRAVACLLLYLACIFLREILEPRLIGRRVGVPAIAILLSIYAGIKLFGIWGIVGGPLGFIMIQQSYLSLERRRNKLTNFPE